MKPVVSVFTLIFNTDPRFIIEALQSIKQQTYQGSIQHIILDDNSTNSNSKKVVKQWIKENSYDCIFIEHSTNKGICSSLNEILSIAEGKYFFGCSDDIILKDKIENEVNIMEGLSEDYAAVYSDAYLIDSDSNDMYGLFIQRYRHFDYLPEGDLFRYLIDGNFLPIMAMMFRLNCIKEIGGFDENLKFEDYDLHLRLSRKYKYALNPKVSAKYRIHNNQFTAKPFKWHLENLKILVKHADILEVRNKIESIVTSQYISNQHVDFSFEYLQYVKSDFLKFFIRNKIHPILYKSFIRLMN